MRNKSYINGKFRKGKRISMCRLKIDGKSYGKVNDLLKE